jgi:hypothetical protein
MARYRDAAQRLVRSLIIAFAYSPTPCGTIIWWSVRLPLYIRE